MKAVAVKDGKSFSSVATAVYSILAARPEFSPQVGEYAQAQQVALTTSTPNALIYYTTDGTDPNDSATRRLYTSLIEVSTDLSIIAIAARNGLANSRIAVASYVISYDRVSQPVFAPAGGMYSENQLVSISCATPEASIYYTLDSTDPSVSATRKSYSGATIPVNVQTTLIAVAAKTGMANSQVAVANYTIDYYTVATPVFSPAPASYSVNQTVTLSCTTPGSVIYYTLDQTDPSVSNSRLRYTSNGIVVSANSSLLAVAVKPGMLNSAVAEGSYVINYQQVSQPQSDTPGGSYFNSLTVHLSCATTGALIYYTTDSSDPNTSNTRYLYTAAGIPVAQTASIFAVGTKPGMTNSELLALSYTIISNTVATPVPSPAQGTYDPPISVALTCATSGASIYYTLDGSIPTTSSSQYTGAFSITSTKTVKALAVKSGMLDSLISNTIYTINAAVALPVFSLVTGTYDSERTSYITCATAGASIYYTTNGSTPTTSSALYTPGQAIAVNTTMALRAIGVKAGMNNSSVVSATYTLAALAPFADIPAGTYDETLTVTLATLTAGAEIRYTTNNTNPTASSTLYAAAIPIPRTTTLKAITVKSGLANSTVLSLAYVLQVATPTTSLTQGTYDQEISVVLSCATAGATIFYTTNGANPTTSSPTYSAPLSITQTTTLRAYAVRVATELTPSAILAATYTIALPTVAAPVISPNGGTFVRAGTSVSLTSATIGAELRYTSDGSTPTALSALYAAPIPVSTTSTLRAIGIKTGMASSTVSQASFIVDPSFVVDGSTFTGKGAALFLAGTDLHASYYDEANRDLKYAFSADSGSTWAVQTIDGTNDVGLYTAIAVSGAVIVIAYYDATNGDLRIAKFSGSWSNSQIDGASADVGRYCSMAVTGDGMWLVAYFDYTNNKLKFAKSLDAFTSAPTIGDIDATAGENVGMYPSLYAVSATSAYVVYYDELATAQSGNLKRAFHNGTTWTAGSVDVTNANSGLYNGSVFTGGNWLASYYDLTNGDLKFAKAYSPYTTWFSYTVDSTGTVGLHTSMDYANGNAYIAYQDATNRYLKIAKSGDLTSWTVSTVYGVGGLHTSMKASGNNIYILYYDDVALKLKLVRSSNGGLSW